MNLQHAILVTLALLATACSGSACRSHRPDTPQCNIFSYGYRSENCFVPRDLVMELANRGDRHTIAVEGNQCNIEVRINEGQLGRIGVYP